MAQPVYDYAIRGMAVSVMMCRDMATQTALIGFLTKNVGLIAMPASKKGDQFFIDKFGNIYDFPPIPVNPSPTTPAVTQAQHQNPKPIPKK